MIEFNFLPDVKKDYIKAERTKRLIVTVSVLVTAAALAILVLLLLNVNILQKKHLSDLNKDIKSESSKLENTSNLNKILTVQNQLNSLTALHQTKPATTRLSSYLDQLTPVQASIANITIDFSLHSVSVSGNADALSTINKYVDTLKFTNYTTDKTDKGQAAFSSVVLSGFSVGKEGTSYNITFNYDPTIFDNTQKVNLVVPNLITTRSEQDKPNELFNSTSSGSN